MKKHLRMVLVVVGACLVSSALAASVAQARTPAPAYRDFAGCPSPQESASVIACFAASIDGGQFKMGSKNVPITNPIRLAGGLTESGEFLYNAEGGLSKVRETVPGGIVGLTGLDWLVNLLNLEGLKLYAITELAGRPGNPIGEPVDLPIKVHLVNPALGSNCYIGSNSNPINLSMTYGTTSPPSPNMPIEGKFPTIGTDPTRAGVFTFTGGTLVDNSFSAPGATGCRIELGLINIGIDGLVDSQSSLPAAAGTNEAVQDIDASFVEPSSLVYP
jgi:hypothetical protein